MDGNLINSSLSLAWPYFFSRRDWHARGKKKQLWPRKISISTFHFYQLGVLYFDVAGWSIFKYMQNRTFSVHFLKIRLLHVSLALTLHNIQICLISMEQKWNESHGRPSPTAPKPFKWTKRMTTNIWPIQQDSIQPYKVKTKWRQKSRRNQARRPTTGTVENLRYCNRRPPTQFCTRSKFPDLVVLISLSSLAISGFLGHVRYLHPRQHFRILPPLSAAVESFVAITKFIVVSSRARWF